MAYGRPRHQATTAVALRSTMVRTPLSKVHNPNGKSGILRHIGTPSACPSDPEHHHPGCPPTAEKKQLDYKPYMARHLFT